MSSFNWFDVVLGMILASSIFAGLRSGLARVIVGLIATVIGFVAAFSFYKLVSVPLVQYVPSQVIADTLGFFTILLGVLLLGAAIGAILSRLLKWVGLSWFNHALGGLAGAVRGVLLIAIMASALIAFAPSPSPVFLNQSRLLPYATPLAAYLSDVAPREVKDAFDAQMQSIKRTWKLSPPQKAAASQT